MTNMEHPDPVALATFAEQPDAQHGVRQHLLHCATCRNKVDAMNTLHSQLGMLLPEMTSTIQPLIDEVEIAAFVDGRIDPAQRVLFAEQIKGDPASLKSALHYATHSAAMQNALEEENHSPATNDVEINLWLRLRHWLASPAPAWGLATAATVLLGINLLFSHPLLQSDPDSLRIANYQDDAKLYFQSNSVPGMGFFHNAQQQQSQDFSGISFELDDANTLRAHWPSVENTAYYTFTLQLSNAAKTQTLSEIRVTTPEAQIKFTPQSGKRYQWLLSGTTRDGKSFQTHGGFVLHKG